MSEEAQRQLTGSLERWQSFLATASRLYKYPYHEQVMIHAQRPDATACAEFDVWNNTMRRYVRRGSKGIALIDTSGDRERLRYVFDVSDTGTRPNSRSLNLWELREEHIPAVSSMLEKNYGVPAGESLAVQLEAVASQLAREYWEDNRRDILGILEDSFLEEYDEFNVGVAFRNAAEVSISYSLMLRCGLEPENYFEHEDFMSVFDFNTPETAGALGTAVSGINQQVLREIGATIRNYEREQIAERSMAYGNVVQAERRLSDPGHQTERTGGYTHREVRADAETVSEGASSDSLEPSGAVGAAVSAPSGDRRDGTPEAGRADAADGEAGRRDGGAEAQRPAEMGGHDEYAEGTGRGDYSERAGVQLTADEPEPLEELNNGYPAGAEFEQLSMNLFLSEQEQISQIDEADRTTEVLSAFSFAQTEIDNMLRFGSNTGHAREHIADAFQKQKPIEEIAALLQREFHGGYGIRGEHGDYAAWYDGDGIHLHKGREARYAVDSQVIIWEAAAERIGQLLEEGSFASNVELAEAGGRVRSELAQSLLYLKHDLSEEANQVGYFSSMDDLPAGYPDATAALAEKMADSAFADTLRGEFLGFLNDYAENRELLRFHYHRMDELWQGVRDISAERRVYPDGPAELAEPQSFITEDEISETLAGGSSMAGGKGRIYAYFTADHTMKEKADFLKQEYGIGGRSHALSGADHSSEDHSAKGIRLTKGGCSPVELNWTKVAELISSLIRKDRYFAQEQKDAYARMHDEPELSEPEEPVQVEPAPEPIKEPVPEPAAVPKPVTADEISDALIRWNGSFESKSRVNDYMLTHGRERGAAAWLKDEFSGADTFSVVTDHGTLELPWAKVQRQLGILVNDGRFFTEADRMLAQAEQIAAQSEVESYERFTVIETDEGYGIWDDLHDGLYVDEEGVTADFDSEWVAENYLLELKEKIAQREAAEWEYVERSKYEAQTEENDAAEVQPDIASQENSEPAEMESVPRFQDDNDLIGAELTLDGRRFAVDEVRDGRASLRDITFQNGTGFPIFRNEPVETVRGILFPEKTTVPQVNLEAELTEAELALMRPQLNAAGIDYLVANAGYNRRTISFSSQHYREVQDMLDALPDNADEVAYSTETDKVYPGEQTGLPYDIVTERLHTEPEHTPPEPEVSTDDAIDANPVSVQIGGEWQTFPNTGAAEQAMYEEYRAQTHRNAQNFRITDPDLPDDPSSKVNMCVDNIYRIWDEGQADRLTQLVFCDLSTPKTGAPAAKAAKSVAGNLDSPELHAVESQIDITPEPEFTVYDDIREKLVARGIPKEQIAFIHEANTEARKKELFAKVRSGQVRVLMGSTFKMGAGMNVQDRLVALHDLDAPWRPGDLEQRSGRIIRQGNRNKQVHIFRYVTEATFDAYLWQTLENKQKFISQIMTSKSPVRSCEDIDETALSYAEIKALCAGDERIKEKMDLDVDVARLKLMKANHQSQQYRLEDNILRHFPEQIEQNKGFIAGFQADMQTLAEHPHPQDGFAGMTVRGDVLTDKENAGAALVDAMKEVKGLEPVPIGSYRGFQMSLTLEDFGKQYVLTLKGKMSHRVELGKDPRGNLIRIDNALAGMETRLARVQEKLDSLYAQMETAKAELGKPFPQEQELKEKSARLAQLNIELNIDDRTPMEAMAEIADSEPEAHPAVSAKSERPSVLAKLHAPLPQRDSHPKQNETEKEVR